MNNVSLRAVSKHRRAIVAASAAAVMLGSVGAAVVVATPANAANTVSRGAGHSYNGHWFGAYRQTIGGKVVNVFCKSPNKGLDRAQTFSTYTNVPGVNAANSWRIKYILGTYGSSQNNRIAAGTYSALNELALNHKSTEYKRYFRPWFKASSASNKKTTVAILAASAKNYGPYKVSSVLSSQPLVGQTGTFTVTLKPAVPGKLVRFTASRADVTGSARTNRKGQVSARFTPTSVGSVSLRATVSGLAGNKVRVSHPAKGQQTLVSTGTTQSLTTARKYYKVTAGPNYGYACTANCFGVPTDTFTATAPASKFKTQFLKYDNGRVTGSLTFNPSSRSATKTVHGKTTDGHKVTFGVRYYVHGKWTAVYKYGRVVVVYCKKPPFVTPTPVCDCKNFKVTFRTPVNPHKTNEYIVINGKPVATAKPHQSATYTVTFPVGKHVSYTYAGAVDNGDGHLNVGPSLTLSQP